VAAESGTRARTRRAILDAAVVLLAGDPTASLGDVAAAAGVGRTTVHRYFPERSDLLAAISTDVLDKVEAAAGPGSTTARPPRPWSGSARSTSNSATVSH
jgi:AcrR family transcriptional regulator